MIFKEDQHTELKEKYKSGTIVNEIVAFLNTCDGTIYIGVKDDGNVCGVDDVNEAMLRLSDIITHEILPSPEGLVFMDSIEYDGKTIITIKVKKGDHLFYIKKYGRSSQGCIKRVGTSSRGMSDKEIDFELRRTIVTKLDICDIPSRQVDFSFRELCLYYASMDFHLNEKTMETTHKLKTKDGQYNLLAELLSDKNSASIKIARFRGKDKSELDEKSEYGYQCLLRAIDRMTDRLEAENYTMSKIEGARRKDKRLMDMSSLREAFINAIGHNDWTICPPAVYIFADRIEIFSYGGLPIGETKEMFFNGASNPRNASLMRVLSDLEYVEQTGHGIPEIVKHYGTKAFDINDNYINVTIPFNTEVMQNHAKNTTIINENNGAIKDENGAIKGESGAIKGESGAIKDENGAIKGENGAIKEENGAINYELELVSQTEKQIFMIIKNNPTITRKEISVMTGKGTTTIYRYLKGLQEKGFIERIGSNKFGYWRIL